MTQPTTRSADPFRGNPSGNPFDFDGPVDLNGQPDAAPADVYLTCIHGDHAFDIPVPDGPYLVRLHLYDERPGGRAMSFTLEGTAVIEDLSIATAAGGAGKAWVLEFDVNVTGGLQIVASKGTGNDVFEAGFEIVSADTEPPVVTITAPADGAAVSGDLLVEGTATDNTAVDRVEVTVDGASYETATGTTDWSHTIFALSLPTGGHTITARATDTAGNQATASIEITADNTPSITILQPVGNEEWQAGSTQHIRWSTANLDDVAIKYSVDGAYLTIVESIAWPGDSETWGNYPWIVPDTATDEATILIHGYFDSSVRAESLPFSIVTSDDRNDSDGGRLVGGCGCQAGSAGGWLVLVWLAWRRLTRGRNAA
ncbi:Ig-like domain-containing protein [Myxococcota bacterium]